MATKAPSIGFLDFGSSDESVIASDPLTATMTTTTMPSSSITTRGTPVHDSVKGLKDGGYQINTLTNGSDMDNQGQITFEVEREWLCKDEQGSEGHTASGNEYCMVIAPAVGNTRRMLYKSTGTDFPQVRMDAAVDTVLGSAYYGGAAVFNEITSIGKSEFVKIGMGWWGGDDGGTMVMSVDGMPLFKGSMPAGQTTTGLGATIHINNLSGGSFRNYYMRNLQFSSKPPVFPVHPKLRRLMLWGDSQTMLLAPNENYRFDNATILSCLRKLAQNKIFAGEALVDKNSGYFIDTGQANDAASVRAAMLAQNPTMVLFRWGTNDAVTYNAANFETDLKAEVTAVMAHPSVEYVIVSNVPSLIGDTSTNTAANQADLATINTIYAGIPAWWDTDNPTNTGKVLHIDNYTAQGGENPPAETYLGQSSGSYDDLHYAGRGCLVEGELFADEILTILGDS